MKTPRPEAFKRRLHLLSRQHGFGLVEALIGVSLLVIASVAYIGAISTSSISVRNMDRRVTAEIVARSQLEHTENEPFQTAPYTYPSITELPNGYSVTSTATSIPDRDDNIQNITAVVQFEGQTVVTIDDYKLNR